MKFNNISKAKFLDFKDKLDDIYNDMDELQFEAELPEDEDDYYELLSSLEENSHILEAFAEESTFDKEEDE